jgi:hypothetical protein
MSRVCPSAESDQPRAGTGARLYRKRKFLCSCSDLSALNHESVVLILVKRAFDYRGGEPWQIGPDQNSLLGTCLKRLLELSEHYLSEVTVTLPEKSHVWPEPATHECVTTTFVTDAQVEGPLSREVRDRAHGPFRQTHLLQFIAKS